MPSTATAPASPQVKPPEITPEASEAWKAREYCRFRDTWNHTAQVYDAKIYQEVPVNPEWPLQYPPDHYVHLSIVAGEEDCVAYTQSEQHGVADRQTRIKFGRYLKKVFPAQSDTWVAELVNRFKVARAEATAPSELKFATDVETINRIFETRMCACNSGSPSCMYNKFHEDTIRPYHVYADSPDVAVAYVTKHNSIISRSVVSTKDKCWVRAYARTTSGDNSVECGILKTMLEELGYSNGDLDGCRLTKLQNRGGVMLPYLDGSTTDVNDEGDYWRVVRSGEYTADSTSGEATENGARCEGCERHTDYCECSYCDCCETRSPHGCDECTMCERCDRCREHYGCQCVRCEDCGELRAGRYAHQHDQCRCDRCETCDELENECECDDRPYHTCEPDPDAKYDGMDADGARAFLNRVFVCLRDTRETAEAERAVLIAAYNRL